MNLTFLWRDRVRIKFIKININFNVMINIISKRHSSVLKGNDSKADLTNYKELYE